MKKIDHLTHERLRNVFVNQFELVNYAIKLAEHLVHSGRDPYVHSEPQNLSTTILEIIENEKDRFKEIPDEATFIAEIESAIIKGNYLDNTYDVEDEDDEEDEIIDDEDDEEDFEETTETVKAV